MYESELLPDSIAIGIDDEKFWTLTPRRLKIYFDGHHKKLLMDDVKSYHIGVYAYEAVSTALGNAFRKKTQKAYTYREKPILLELEEKEKANLPLTEDEKKRQTELLFAKLGMMQANFVRTHKENEDEAISVK